MAGGRPTKLTPKRQELLVNAIRIGVPYSTACKYVGIAKSTFDEWRHRGQKETEGKYRKFWLAICEAEATVEIAAVGALRSHWEKSPMAPVEFLKRRFPDNWSDRIDQRVAVQAKVEVEETKRYDLSMLSLEELEVLRWLQAKMTGEDLATATTIVDLLRVEKELVPKFLTDDSPVNGNANGEDET